MHASIQLRAAQHCPLQPSEAISQAFKAEIATSFHSSQWPWTDNCPGQL